VGAAIVASSPSGKGTLRAKPTWTVQASLYGAGGMRLPPRFHIVSAPPLAPGGVVTAEIRTWLEGYPLLRLGYRSRRRALPIEAMRTRMFDRNGYLCDPDFVKMASSNRLLDKSMRKSLRARCSTRNKPAVPRTESRRGPRMKAATHALLDRRQDGHAVSVTYTLTTVSARA